MDSSSTQTEVLVSAEQLAQLKALKLGDSKRTIGILIKRKNPFFTKLENFQKPADCALIGIFPEQIRRTIPKVVSDHFEMIFWLKVGKSYLVP